MKVDQKRLEIRDDFERALYFIDNYLMIEDQLLSNDDSPSEFRLDNASHSDAYRLGQLILESEIGRDILRKFGYLIMRQDDAGLVVKKII